MTGNTYIIRWLFLTDCSFIVVETIYLFLTWFILLNWYYVWMFVHEQRDTCTKYLLLLTYLRYAFFICWYHVHEHDVCDIKHDQEQPPFNVACINKHNAILYIIKISEIKYVTKVKWKSQGSVVNCFYNSCYVQCRITVSVHDYNWSLFVSVNISALLHESFPWSCTDFIVAQ